MEMSISVPALLFPAISLLLLAYTNRFLGISSIIRKLYDDYRIAPNVQLARQIVNLRRRVSLIRSMQALGVLSILLCVLSMFCMYFARQHAAHALFGISLVSMLCSLVLSLMEIWMSSDALNILLADIEESLEQHGRD